VFASGVRSPWALAGFGLVALVVTVTLYDYTRGVRARMRSTGESPCVALWRRGGRYRRRYGGYIVHLGVVMMALGVIGIEMFQTEPLGTLQRGESLRLGRYEVTFRSLAIFDTEDGRNVARAVMAVSRDGQPVGELYPRRDFYFDSGQPMTIPGLRSTMEDDVYILLVDWEPISTENATFKIYVNPLVNWLWLGGMVFIVGMMVAAWPSKEPELDERRAARRAAVKAAAVGD